MAGAAVRQDNLMRDSNKLSLITTIVAGLAACFAAVAARSASNSYKAFVAAEDARLDVEFRDGAITESVIDGVQQPDSYSFETHLANIGRTTARAHYCTIGTQRFDINHFLKQHDTLRIGLLPVDTLKRFNFVLYYSTPIRPVARLVVIAKPEKTGRGRVSARVLKVRIKGKTG